MDKGWKMSITTKIGDTGKTQLFSGQFIWKDSLRPKLYGDIDELVCILGSARLQTENDETLAWLLRIQRLLFIVASECATLSSQLDKLEKRVDQAMVNELEGGISHYESSIDMPDGFIIPGGTVCACHIDHARAITRRCERRFITLIKEDYLKEDQLIIQIWFNRLSDFLWLLARFEEKYSLLL